MYTIKLMSFNIDGLSRNRGAALGWNNRAPLCASILGSQDADVVGLQEVHANNRAALELQLSAYDAEYGVVANLWQDDVHNPIFWRRDRFTKSAAGGYYLSPTPGQRSRGWDSDSVRSATWVALRCLRTGLEFIHVNVHMDNRGVRARAESVKLVIRELMHMRRDNVSAAVVSGDFNARPWSPPDENVDAYPLPILPQYLPRGNLEYRTFMESNYNDTYLKAGNGNKLAMNTYHDYCGGDFPACALRVDWILTLGGRAKLETTAHNVEDAWPALRASDHYAVVADLAWS